MRAITTLLSALRGSSPRAVFIRLTSAGIVLLGAISALLALLIWMEWVPPTRGGESDEALSFADLARDSGTLVIEVSIDPSGGPYATPVAPLNDVDLTALLPPTTLGEVTYLFDCTADGTPEMSITTASTRATAVDVCDYPDPGNYVARVRAVTASTTLEGVVGIVVQSWSLVVNGFARPSLGPAPLMDVDLVAAVTGTATGDITYSFDCTADGIWDSQETVTGYPDANAFIAEDLCSYPEPGWYTATWRVERGGLSFQGSSAVFAESP